MIYSNNYAKNVDSIILTVEAGEDSKVDNTHLNEFVKAKPNTRYVRRYQKARHQLLSEVFSILSLICII